MSSTTLKKIGIIGTQCVGKSTLIENMKEKWPSFVSPTKSYRDLVKKNKLPLNKKVLKSRKKKFLIFL